MSKPSYTSKSDILGMTTSILCMIHCAIPPVLIASNTILTISVFSSWWESFHILFLLLSLIAILLSLSKTNHIGIQSLMGISWIGFALGYRYESFEIHGANILLYLSSLGLVIAHGWNIYHQRKLKAAPQTN